MKGYVLLFLCCLFPMATMADTDSQSLTKAIDLLTKYSTGKIALGRYKNLKESGMQIDYLQDNTDTTEGASFTMTSSGKITLLLRKNQSPELLAIAITHELQHITDLTPMLGFVNSLRYGTISKDEAPVKHCLRQSSMSSCQLQFGEKRVMTVLTETFFMEYRGNLTGVNLEKEGLVGAAPKFYRSGQLQIVKSESDLDTFLYLGYIQERFHSQLNSVQLQQLTQSVKKYSDLNGVYSSFYPELYETSTIVTQPKVTR